MRYIVSISAGSVNGRRFAVIDTLDKQGGKGMKRVEFHRTEAAAREACRRLNRQCPECGTAEGHSATCPLRDLERDHELGSEYIEED